MDQKFTLAWIYVGSDPGDRLETVAAMDNGRMEVIAVGNAELRKSAELLALRRPGLALRTVEAASLDAIWEAASPDAAALVLWIDDGKLVNATFPREMAAPVLGSQAPGCDRHVHFWDGDALAISRPAAEATALGDLTLKGDCLLSLLADLIEQHARLGGGRFRLMFSPLERYTAVGMEPLGLAS